MNLTSNLTSNIKSTITSNLTSNITSNLTSKKYSNDGFILFICVIVFIATFLAILTVHIQSCGCKEYSSLKKFLKKICNKLYNLNTNDYYYSSSEEDEEYDQDYTTNLRETIIMSIEEDNYKTNRLKIKSFEIKEIITFSNRNKYPIFCSICQEYNYNTIITNCNHNFCEECIKTYLKDYESCPNCKREIKTIFKISPIPFTFSEEETVF